jgi:predicted amidohydrolase
LSEKNDPTVDPTVDPLDAPSDAIPVAVVQFSPAPNASGNVDSIRSFVEAASGAGARLLVMPEYAHAFAGSLGDWVNSVAEPLDGPFVSDLIQISAESDVALIAGMLERSADADKPFNTLVAIHPQHGLVGHYRKVHLYDAFGARESDWISAGDPAVDAVVVELAGLQVGLQTCYDLRFPEVSRRLVDAGADVLAVPSEWLAGPKKAHHWVALTAARAIENLCYVVAADQIAPIAVGMSRIISPLGETLIDMGQDAGIAVAFISPDALAQARANNPALSLRKYRVSPLH